MIVKKGQMADGRFIIINAILNHTTFTLALKIPHNRQHTSGFVMKITYLSNPYIQYFIQPPTLGSNFLTLKPIFKNAGVPYQLLNSFIYFQASGIIIHIHYVVFEMFSYVTKINKHNKIHWYIIIVFYKISSDPLEVTEENLHFNTYCIFRNILEKCHIFWIWKASH